MSAINDGGAAFPIPSYLDKPTENGERLIIMESNGISLRDYFASKAMQSLISSLEHIDLRKGADNLHVQLALTSYQLADSMLAERKKGQSE